MAIDPNQHSGDLAPAQAAVIFDDGHLLALHKPSGLSLLKDRSGAPCLWDALPELIGGKPHLVHRLDKGTSGVLLIARDAATQKRLVAAFRERLVRKYYLARVVGRLERGGLVDLPLRKGRKSRYRVAGQRADIVATAAGWSLSSPGGDGLESRTRLRPLEVGPSSSLVLAQPLTGRTHQLRVHLAWLGHPILGDHLYGRPSDPRQRYERLLLHAHTLIVPGYPPFRAHLDGEGW